MWLRDALPNDFGQFRVITYGYNSRLEDSKNAQGIEEIAGEFVAGLAGIRRRAPVCITRTTECSRLLIRSGHLTATYLFSRP